MGYTTEFQGSFEFNKKLDASTHALLNKLNETRRMKRNVGPEYGVEGELYVFGGGYGGQDHEDNIVDYNQPPRTQPSLWCKWRPTEDGLALEWDGMEKFYNYTEWLIYIINKILEPKGYVLNGTVIYRGEEFDDFGTITITKNIVAQTQWKYPDED